MNGWLEEFKREHTPQGEGWQLKTWVASRYPGVEPGPFRGGRKWVLPCPWSAGHTQPDPNPHGSLIEYADGTILYKCFHHSCRGRTWEDLRWYTPLEGNDGT